MIFFAKESNKCFRKEYDTRERFKIQQVGRALGRALAFCCPNHFSNNIAAFEEAQLKAGSGKADVGKTF